jgi:cytochrome c-type biogenesis protein CcmH/NrfG
MRGATLAFLLAGFGVGSAAVYFGMNHWLGDWVDEKVRPLPQWVRPGTAPIPPPDPVLVRQLEDTLSGDPRNFEALRELGNIQFDQRDFEAAASLYARALEVRPDHVNTRADRGLALLQLNRVDDAITELRRSIELSPNHPQALFYLGLILLEFKNDPKGAAELWKRLVATSPDFPEIDLVKEKIREIESGGQQR